MPAGSTYDRVQAYYSLAPAARTNGTVNGSAVDTAADGGADSVGVFVISGAVTDGTHTHSVEESADGSTGWTAITAPRVIGTATVLGSSDDNEVNEFGVTTSLRYVRLVCVTSGATTGGIFGGGFVIDGNRSAVR